MFLVSFPQKSRRLSLKIPNLCVYSICDRPCGLTDDGKLGSIALYNSKNQFLNVEFFDFFFNFYIKRLLFQN